MDVSRANLEDIFIELTGPDSGNAQEAEKEAENK